MMLILIFLLIFRRLRPLSLVEFSLVIHAGPLATKSGEPGQARKGAATVVDSGAEVWLAWSHLILRTREGS